MRIYHKLLDAAEQQAQELSTIMQSIVGVFQNIDTNEFYAAYDCNDIRFCDTFVSQYQHGEVLDINPDFFGEGKRQVVYLASANAGEGYRHPY